jgi:FtsH-binding integral membrane protein
MSDFDRNAAATPWGSGVARAGTAAYDQGLRSYMLGIYNHMTLALGISGLIAWGTFMAATDQVGGRFVLNSLGQALYLSPLKWLVMLAPLAFVFVLSFRFERMSYGALLGTFWAFAAAMGLSMSSIFVVFKLGSVGQVFAITAAMFGATSLYGYTTQRSLSGMGSFLIMGLFGLIIANVVNMFLQSSAFQFAISIIGVLIFAGLTAWDTQRLKEEYSAWADDSVMAAKASVMGALTLYLDFINMFQFLLSLMGQRNND